MKRVLLTFMMLVLVSFYAIAQDREVKGKVTDETGQGLPGVNVLIKGTTTGVATQPDGTYQLSAPASGVLVFRFLGYVIEERSVGSQTTINVQLVPEVSNLGEFVVTGVAAATPAKKIPFTVSSVNEKVFKQAPATDVGSALAGKIAGVRVQPSNVPGGGPGIQIRGNTSLSRNNGPLIVLDGVFIEGSLANINLQDVERFEVLKGASAATLYGSRAADGVIAITTKRGKDLAVGTTQVYVRTEVGTDNAYQSRTPDKTQNHPFRMNPATGDFFLDNTGTAVDDPSGISDGVFPRYRNFVEDFFEGSTFFTQYARLSSRGATGNVVVSAEYQNQTGGIKLHDGSQRYNLSMNADQYLGEKLTLSTSAKFIQTQNDNRPRNIRTLIMMDPSADLLAVNEEDGSPYNYNANRFSPTSEFNPFYQLVNSNSESTRRRFIGASSIKYDISRAFSLEGRFGIDTWLDKSQSFQDIGYLANQGSPGVGSVGRAFSDYQAITSSIRATYAKKLGDWNIRSNAFFLYENRGGTGFNMSGSNLGIKGFNGFDNVTRSPNDGIPFLSGDSRMKDEIVSNSYSVSVGGDYMDKYLFDVVVRRDGSSLFGVDNRWNTFARFSGGWRFTEDFDIDGIQEGKINASWGQAGTLPNFDDKFERAFVNNGQINNPSNLANLFLGPGITDEVEIGLNLEFLNKFSFLASYSKQDNRDQILSIPLSSIQGGGRTSQVQNAGTLETNTLEFTLGYTAIKKSDMNLDFNVIFDRTRQEITEFNRPRFPTGINIWDVGNSPTTMFGSKIVRSIGDLTLRNDGTVANVGGNLTPADFKVNRDGHVIVAANEFTAQERAIFVTDATGAVQDDLLIGDAQPEFNMAMQTNFNYKGFSVFMSWEYQNGGTTYNQGAQWLGRDRLHPMFSQGQYPDGQKQFNSYLLSIYNVNKYTDYWAEDATHLRLRELSVAYDFGSTQLSKIGLDRVFKNVNVSVIGRNLLLFAKYTGYDPATGGFNSRVDDFNFPLVRTFTGAVSFTF
ncbi:SusC/RagA family TonB-linked outer membrane protein [Roseivirga echinicomitans]